MTMRTSRAGTLCGFAILGVCLLPSGQGSDGLSASEIFRRARLAVRAGAEPTIRSITIHGSLRSSLSGDVGSRTITLGTAERFTYLRETRPNSRLGEYSATAREGNLTVALAGREVRLAPDAASRVLRRLDDYRLVFLLDLPADCLDRDGRVRKAVEGGWTVTTAGKCGAREVSFSPAPPRLQRIVSRATVIPGSVGDGGGLSSQLRQETDSVLEVSDYRLAHGMSVPFRVTQRVGSLNEVFTIDGITLNAPLETTASANAQGLGGLL
jgi:hypothetical protein